MAPFFTNVFVLVLENKYGVGPIYANAFPSGLFYFSTPLYLTFVVNHMHSSVNDK